MAQKNFFVDINLQGNKLANSVVGANSSMTVGGSFQYAEGRLEYFDGATVQEVANLADISAVTGGLIFQGGYDAATDTPDITDGTALKGFFWAVSTAGSFLGESVQVGDSIIAKVDNAGATFIDWLILQGNVVIATDSVDGIVRLATQTEANDGTEGGAVVITPATLQGKIDAQITPTISSKLPLAGGTMSGGIDMAENTIDNVSVLKANDFYTNGIASKAVGGEVYLLSPVNANGNNIGFLPAPTADGDAANKLYVDNASNDKLPLAGGTMTGNLDMSTNSISNAVLSNGSLGNEFNAVNNKITNLGTPTNDGDAANKIYVDGAASAADQSARAYADSLAPNYDAAGSAATAETNANAYTDAGLDTKLSLSGGTMSGGINMDGYTLSNVDTITGGSKPVTMPDGIESLPAPTADGDAANKLYVDTEIAKLNNVFVIETTDWTLVNGSYQATLLHGVTAGSVSAQFMDLIDDEFVEFAYFTSPIYITVKSNFIPNEAIRVLAYGAN